MPLCSRLDMVLYGFILTCERFYMALGISGQPLHYRSATVKISPYARGCQGQTPGHNRKESGRRHLSFFPIFQNLRFPKPLFFESPIFEALNRLMKRAYWHPQVLGLLDHSGNGCMHGRTHYKVRVSMPDEKMAVSERGVYGRACPTFPP